MSEYLERIIENLRAIDAEEGGAISRAADLAADVIVRDGIVFVFGCGHSHLPALDAFYRAGGLANVSPILDDDLMLHNGAAKSSRMEKMPGLADEVFRRYRVTPNDLLVIISASGKNAVPVEMAKAGRAAGVTTVAIVVVHHQVEANVTSELRVRETRRRSAWKNRVVTRDRA